MGAIIGIGIITILLGLWYVFRDVGEPNLNSDEWYIGDVDSTNEKEGDRGE